MADPLRPPSIPDLKSDGWIDFEELGSADLLTYINYDGIQVDDILWPNWRGCSKEGIVSDMAGARVDVTIEDGYDEVLGMPVSIPNSVFTGMDQGWAFYSYALGDPANPTVRGDESLRTFVYLGKRAPGLLPVPQIKESHDLALDGAGVVSPGVTAVVPPYRAMNVGDTVVFCWQGYDKYGNAEDPFFSDVELEVGHLGQPLSFVIPRSELIFIKDGHAVISYAIKYSNGLSQSNSAQQIIKIAKPTSSLLSEITIKGHSGGPIDPSRFPKGLNLQIKPVYDNLQPGDVVLMYWTGIQSVIQSIGVDRSTFDSGVLEFQLTPNFLSANVGDVVVGYQYARAGAGESGTPLSIKIVAPQKLPPPYVDNVTTEGTNKGWIPADTSGAYVNIPDEVTIGPGVTAEVHWMGHPNGGQYIARDHVAGSPRRFKIPKTAIAANMATADQEEKRFDVFYKLIPLGDDSGQSSDAPFRLRIAPLPERRYPSVECAEAEGNGQLSLSGLGTSAATLNIGGSGFDAWPFMAEGQLLTIEASGLAAVGGSALKELVRAAVPVTREEFTSKLVTERLSLDFLKRLKLDWEFTLTAKVSFDGGESYKGFQSQYITLIK